MPNPIHCTGPLVEDFVTLQSRLDSFSNWPLSFIKPADLANAGFYYVGESTTLYNISPRKDGVQCFYCGLCLNNWEPNDCPYIEHAIHTNYRSCAYLLVNKHRAKNPAPLPVVEEDKNICKVCRLFEAKYVYLPCAHFVCCPICVCSQSKCPVCRTNVDSMLKIYV